MAEGILWQTLQLPFTSGLQQKADDRARRAPFLDIARDIAFDEIGGAQSRLPYLAMSNGIFGGGTLSSCRRLAVVNGELVVFTDTAVYSWNAQLTKWVLRATHLAVAVDETPRFATTGDQIDGDRAELSGTIVYAWTEGGQIYAAATDKTTGSVLAPATALTSSTSRPRIVALATKLLLFTGNGSTINVRSIDPANPAAGFASGVTQVAASVAGGPYDVVKVEGQDLAVGAFQRSTTTSYTVFTVTPAAVVTSSTKARTCDGPIAVATVPGTGAQTQIIRANSSAIQGDFVTTATLADVTTAQAIGTNSTPINQIAACYQSVQTSGAFRCYAFWSNQESASASFLSTSNFVDTAGTIGTAATFVRNIGVASRAFDYAGRVYVWMAFAESAFSFGTAGPALQNTYLLYRDDAAPVSKSVAAAAGGYSPSTGRLPGVALTAGTTTYSWCGTFRRQIPLGDGAGYAARAPKDIDFTFDANAARRTAPIGRTLYVSGGELLQYDGVRLVEVGFNVFPYALNPANGAGAGAMVAGVYGYKVTWRYQNAQLEQERSTTASIESVIVAGTAVTASGLKPLTTTRKTANPPAVEIWRSAVNTPPESPFFLATSKDPASTSNPNRYLANDPTVTNLPSFDDFLSDADITQREANPENGAVLESIAPPGAKIIIATDTRLFLAGVSGRPDQVWYSRARNEGEIASFHDTLRSDVPRVGGDAITAIWFQDEVLYAARQHAVYALPGPGKDNLGQGQNPGPARTVSVDVGVVNHESVALTPRGTIFQSRKGWQLLRGDGSLDYIGEAVSDFDSETVLSVDVVETRHEVRILTAARMIVWHYLVDQWSERTISDGLHSLMWAGQHVYLTATGPKVEQAAYSALTYGLDVETTWIKPGALAADVQNNVGPGGQAASRIRTLQPFGEVRSPCLVRLRLGYNYKAGYVDDLVRDISALSPGDLLQLKYGPKRPQCQAIKLRITAVTDAVRATLHTGVGLSPLVAKFGGTGIWASTWQAVTPGELGNALSMSLAFASLGLEGSTPFTIDVRDHFQWSTAASAWVPAVGTIGVLVSSLTGFSPPLVPTIAQLEAAIAAGTALATLTAADPGGFLDSQTMVGLTAAGSFGGGLFGAPTGEAIKLTGLGLEVGIEPGLYKRIPSGAHT